MANGQDDKHDDSAIPESSDVSDMGTLYNLARKAMKASIPIYLELARKSRAFSAVESGHVQTIEEKSLLLGGIGSSLDPTFVSPQEVVNEWERMRAVPFEIEPAITRGVYLRLRTMAEQLVDELERTTQGFQVFDALYIVQHPYMLPILQRLAGISSKADLKKRIGNASDAVISAVAARKLADILQQRQPSRSINHAQLLQGIEPTLEGIVRDLVGRVLLEDIVTNALDEAGIPYKRESEYSHLEGAIYSFRAGYVIPDEKHPKAFIEVRKSSSRHASLYAKDKLFSAINWKGKTKDLLAILVVDGPWTAETLRVLATVYEYVIPLHAVAEMAQIVAAYLRGDKTKLKWLVTFVVEPAQIAPEEDTI
ncbi:MAG TPA: hypothetical protein VKQ36_04280 [Ktedonobacterales bacterium]|nr:hypothetical protein [Ktedonobacterales bacterium]